MNIQIKSKLLQYIFSKNNNQGLTLIELVVVIFIMGILAAIALPSFLVRVNKGKQSESKTYVGTLNKGQQAYFTEKEVFSNNIPDLGVGIKTQTVNYTYYTKVIGNGASPTAYSYSRLNNPNSAFRNYSGLVSLIKSDSSKTVTSIKDLTTTEILCETTKAEEEAIKPIDYKICGAGSIQVGGTNYKF